jgi:predicted  nucleic acid-binding Zn-ribbon protein
LEELQQASLASRKEDEFQLVSCETQVSKALAEETRLKSTIEALELENNELKKNVLHLKECIQLTDSKISLLQVEKKEIESQLHLMQSLQIPLPDSAVETASILPKEPNSKFNFA